MKPTIAVRVTKARTRLLLDQPWFGSLAMRLKIVPADIETFDVDGTALRYSPTFADSLTDDELEAVLAHEVMHCALLHMFRRGNRDHRQWNEACDYAINGELVKAGFKLPKDGLLDSQFDGLSADVIYARRVKQPQPQNQGEQPSTGSVNDAPAPAPDAPSMTQDDWKIATEQATAVAKGCGKVPGGIETAVKSARKDAEDWRAILREFIEHTVPSDYSWTAPNRRHIANGVYLPGMTKENLGHIAVAVDTSGSIDNVLLEAFCGELNQIAGEAKPEKITVMYCDMQVHKTEEFATDDPITMTAVGRGGTAFSPVFAAVDTWETPPSCLIYFTDLDGDNPSEPEYPVLWATGVSVTKSGPFGRTIRIAEGV